MPILFNLTLFYIWSLYICITGNYMYVMFKIISTLSCLGESFCNDRQSYTNTCKEHED